MCELLLRSVGTDTSCNMLRVFWEVRYQGREGYPVYPVRAGELLKYLEPIVFIFFASVLHLCMGKGISGGHQTLCSSCILL